MVRVWKESFLLFQLAIVVLLQVLSLHDLKSATADGVKTCAPTVCNVSISDDRSVSIGVRFPFGVDQGCGASEEFLLSGCNIAATDHSTELLWDGFQHFYKANSTPQASPYISNIAHSNTSLMTAPQIVNITWNRTVFGIQPNESCAVNITHLDNITQYFPAAEIDFSQSPFSVSNTTSILLFGCDQIPQNTSTSNFYNNSSLCFQYRNTCELINYQCIEWKPSTQINITATMKNNGCEYFQLMVSTEILSSATETSSSNNVITQIKTARIWKNGIMQIQWSNDSILTIDNCSSCLESSGWCGYDPNITSSDSFQCHCPANNITSSYNCSITPNPTSATDSTSNKNKDSISRKIILSIAVASTVALLLLLLCFFFMYRRRRFKKSYTTDRSIPSIVTSINKIWTERANLLTRKFGLVMAKDPVTANSFIYEHPVTLSYAVLQTATHSFTDKIGEGGFGEVYKGTLNLHSKHPRRTSYSLDSKVEIAVKVMDPDSRHSSKQFVNEVSTIGSIQHVNVVRLLGFCTENSKRILVYEYVANGSLDKWLFSNRSANSVTCNKTVLNWNLRYTIAVEVARGLCYLHEECRHMIVHCDIKPQNILLDEYMSPKISDFGLAKLITRRGDAGCVMTMAKGTPGYVAPEFWMGGESRLTTKFDVYSYGMVLLELISGRPNFKDGQFGKVCFPVEAYEATKKENFRPLLDGSLIHCLCEEELEKLRTVTLVGLWCVQDSPDRRPSMKEVIQFLEGTMVVPDNPPPPAILTCSTLFSSLNIQSGIHLQTDQPNQMDVVPSHVQEAVLLSAGR